MNDQLAKYLQLLAVEGRFNLGLKPTAERKKLTPLFSYTLMVRLNKELATHEWELKDDTVQHLPPWTRAAFTKAIQGASEWAGTGPQLEDTIDKFGSLGYLMVSSGNFAATRMLIEFLVRHAGDLYQHILQKPPPNDWSSHKGSWLDFNAMVFNFFNATSRIWREVRTQINNSISHAKQLARGWDSLGQNPAYWIVFQLAGMNEGIDEWMVISEAKSFGFVEWVRGPKVLVDAQNDLLKFKILVRDKSILKIAPAFQGTYEQYLQNINDLAPRFYLDCKRWSSKASLV